MRSLVNNCTVTKEDKKLADKYIRKFYKAMKADSKLRVRIKRGLHNSDFDVFKNDMPTQISGIYEQDPKSRYKISLNPDRKRGADWMLRTIIHELLHDVEADKPHTWIDPMEVILYHTMTDRQLTNLMKRAWR